MITRVFLFLIGFGFMVIGLTYIIAYLNLLSFGYTSLDYLEYISKQFECYFPLIGLLLIGLTIHWKGDTNDIHI